MDAPDSRFDKYLSKDKLFQNKPFNSQLPFPKGANMENHMTSLHTDPYKT